MLTYRGEPSQNFKKLALNKFITQKYKQFKIQNERAWSKWKKKKKCVDPFSTF